MSEGGKFGAIFRTGGNTIGDAFAGQVDYCLANDAPITARVVAAIGACAADPRGNPFFQRIHDWPGPPIADALPLRAAGGFHALHLSGVEPDLKPIYRGEEASDEAIVRRIGDHRVALLTPWLDSPPQTNEAGRSSSYVAALLWLASIGLPGRFECFEIGSSAGINLMIDRYRYDLGGVQVGPPFARMRLAPEWRGAPPPDTAIAFERLAGCDVAPIDLTDPAQALRLKAFVWPEAKPRFERIAAAIEEAETQKPELVAMNAASFVEAALAEPHEPGTTRVLMHSIVWQYVAPEQRARIVALLNAAGAAATPEKPLAWIALEANRSTHQHELAVRWWPRGHSRHVRLAHAHAHGAWVQWLGAPQETSWPD